MELKKVKLTKKSILLIFPERTRGATETYTGTVAEGNIAETSETG